MLSIERYIRASSPAEAYEMCLEKSSVVLGGMLWLKQQHRRVGTAIDLCDLGLDAIQESESAFMIGAMVTLRELECHPGLNRLTDGALAAALAPIVGVQFRNLATVGGSVFGRFGFSDVLTILMALDAQIELASGRIMPITEFCDFGPRRDVLLRVIVPKTPVRIAYLAQRNQKTDFPVLTTAIAWRDDGICSVIGARPLRAMRFLDEKGILNGTVTEESARAYAEDIAIRVPLAGNYRAGEAYRRQLCRVLVRRGLQQLAAHS